MRVMVHLMITGEKETILEGEAPIFGNRDYKKGFDNRLRDIGFWLSDWRYADHSGPKSTGRVFIPWGSALMVIESK